MTLNTYYLLLVLLIPKKVKGKVVVLLLLHAPHGRALLNLIFVQKLFHISHTRMDASQYAFVGGGACAFFV